MAVASGKIYYQQRPVFPYAATLDIFKSDL
jgi:hypothetical protein